MDGLAEFEKELALKKASREGLERKVKKHRHHHHHYHEHRQGREASINPDDKEKTQDRHRSRDGGRDKGEEHSNMSSDYDSHTGRADKDSWDKHERERSRDDQGLSDESSHRNKRSRHTGYDTDRKYDRQRQNKRDNKTRGGKSDPKYLQTHDLKEDLPLPNDEMPIGEQSLTRDSWMTAPSGVGIDYIHRPRKEKTPPPNDTTRHHISVRELNSAALESINCGRTVDQLGRHAQPTPNYTFGDEGSQWRMTKLEGVYAVAEQSGRSVEEIAVERFGSLREFDEAREERTEMERRRLYGKGYAVKEKPTGDIHRKRSALTSREPTRRDHGDSGDDNDSGAATRTALEQHQAITPVDQTTLNRLRAQLMKAKLRKNPDVPKIEEEYNQAVAAFSQGGGTSAAERAVVLDASHSRMLVGTRGEVKSIETRRGKQRGLVEANNDMSIEDMVREERRTRGVAGGEGLRLAERIAKDSKFDNDLEYLDENAEKLAKRVHKSDSNLKNIAVHELTKMNKVMESCPLCHHEDRNPPQDLPLAPIISLATRVFLTLPTEPELTGADGGAVIVPIEHHTNLLECSEDEWEEIRNFMKSLTRLYHDQGRDVIFYENAAAPHRSMHAALIVVPIPYELGDTTPAFFREAMLSADEEWSQHKKIIDTGKRAREGLGKSAFRKSIAKEMPYFHAWFSLDGGLGHVIEDGDRWPKGDLFAREVIGGMLDVDASVVKRQGRWIRNDPRLDDFKTRWRKFDWTRILAEA